MTSHEPHATRACAPPRAGRRRPATSAWLVALGLVACWPQPAAASLLSGEALDTAANAVAWLALIIVPFRSGVGRVERD